MHQEDPGPEPQAPSGRWTADEDDLVRSSAYWSRTLANVEVDPEEPTWLRRRGAPEEEAPAEEEEISEDTFWRHQRRFMVVSALAVLVAALVVIYPLGGLQWLAGPEDPPLRVVRPDGLMQQQVDGSWREVLPGAQVPPGSHVRSIGTAILRVRGGGSLRLQGDSVLKVQRLVRREDDSYQVRSMLFAGRAFVRELSGDTLPVDTTFTRIQPIRASYQVSHQGEEANPFTEVRVFSGRVVVGLSRGRMADVTLQPGQSIRVADGRMGTPQPMSPPGPWESWNMSWTNTDEVPPFVQPAPSAAPPAREGAEPREGALDEHS